jgi:uridine kinase
LTGVENALPFPESDRSLVIGIAGGSGSGKTTISSAVVAEVGERQVAVLEHDSYYRHLEGLTFEERSKINYDHPDSLETELLVQHLETLLDGHAVERPVYDFTQHLRSSETVRIEPSPVIVVDGILVLADPQLRALLDLKVFVDTDADLRVLRRLQRDIEERGRTMGSVIRQYLATVRPMHLQFVEPSKVYADLIIPEGYNRGAVAAVLGLVRQRLGEDHLSVEPKDRARPV